MTAPQAAGVIHTDFERGFIRAETVSPYSFPFKCQTCGAYIGISQIWRVTSLLFNAW